MICVCGHSIAEHSPSTGDVCWGCGVCTCAAYADRNEDTHEESMNGDLCASLDGV